MAQGPYVNRRRAYGTLTADIEDFVSKSKDRLEAVVKFSLKDVVENAQTPTTKGGSMRVDTGFLRASGRASTTGFPSGPDKRPSDAPVGQYTGIYDNYEAVGGAAVDAVLLDMELGDTFYFGWTANYAKYRELYDGFLERSLQNWPRYVAFNSDRFRDS